MLRGVLSLWLTIAFLALAGTVLFAWYYGWLWAFEKVVRLSGGRPWLFLLLWCCLIVGLGDLLLFAIQWARR